MTLKSCLQCQWQPRSQQMGSMHGQPLPRPGNCNRRLPHIYEIAVTEMVLLWLLFSFQHPYFVAHFLLEYKYSKIHICLV